MAGVFDPRVFDPRVFLTGTPSGADRDIALAIDGSRPEVVAGSRDRAIALGIPGSRNLTLAILDT